MIFDEIEFGKLATFRNGLNFSNKSHGKGCKIIGIPDFGDRSIPDYDSLGEINPEGIVKSEDYLTKGDIVFVRSNGNKNLVGRSLYISKTAKKLVYSGFCIRARIHVNEAYPKFYAHFFRTALFRQQISGAAGGANIQNLNQGILSRAVVPLPPLPIQRKIASILSAYDDLIENNLKRIKLLEELAQRTYEEWFVKFTMKGEKLAINEETGLPEGWGRKQLSEISTVTSSKRIFLSDYTENGIPFYRSKEIIQKFNFENIEKPLFISRERYNEIKEKFGSPQIGDFLITSVGTLGYVHLVNDTDEEFYFKDGNLIWIRNGESKLTHYLFFKFRSCEFKTYLNSIAIGSSQKALTIEALKKTDICIPGNEILKDFYLFVNPVIKQLYKLSNQNRLLKESRDILLPKLMSGAIDLEKTENQTLSVAAEPEIFYS